MATSCSGHPPDPGDSPAKLRAKAARAREHARSFAGDEIARKLLDFAADLEATADALDAAAPAPDAPR